MAAPQTSVQYARFATLWFGLQFVWGAILAVSLQARSSELAPQNGLRAYAFIAAVGAIVGTATQLGVGPFADRLFARRGNRRALYVAGTAITLPALAGFYLAPNYAECVAAFFVLQLGMNVVTGPYAAIIPDYVPQRQTGSATSWMGTLQSAGNAGGLIVAGFLDRRELVALVLIATLAVCCVVTTRATKNARAQRSGAGRLSFGRDIRTLIASRAAINLGFYTLLGFLYFFVEQSLVTPHLKVRMQTALLFLTFTLANVAGALVAAKPVDRYDKRAVVLVANGVVAIGLMMLASATNARTAFIAAGITGTAWGAYFVADWALACSLLPRTAMASAMGVWNVAATLPQIIAPALTAPLVQRFNDLRPGSGPRLAIGLAILEFTIGAVWLYRLPKLAPARPHPG